MTIRERVIFLSEENHISQKELAASINAPATTVNGWFKNDNRSPSSEYLIPICELFSVSVEWLLTGKEATIAKDDMEEVLLSSYRLTDVEGKARIIQICMNEKDRIEKKTVATSSTATA